MSVLSNYPIVDVRLNTDFSSKHLGKSANIPWPSFFERLFELPDPAKKFVVITNDTFFEDVSQQLEKSRYKPAYIVRWSDLPFDSLDESMFASGCSCHQLWTANPLLKEFIETIATPSCSQNNTDSQKNTDTQENEKLHVTHGKKPIYIDLGCGAGRELVFMAQYGYQSLGYDRMQDCNHRAQALATSSGVNVDVVQSDIEQDSFQPALQADVISVFRFLYRPMLAKLDAWLKPGGFLVYQTFMQGCEQFGSPRNPNYLLRPNELKQAFSHMEILVDRVDYLADGRPVQSFIAQKR